MVRKIPWNESDCKGISKKPRREPWLLEVKLVDLNRTTERAARLYRQ
jgi:hypothetical protein